MCIDKNISVTVFETKNSDDESIAYIMFYDNLEATTVPLDINNQTTIFASAHQPASHLMHDAVLDKDHESGQQHNSQ